MSDPNGTPSIGVGFHGEVVRIALTDIVVTHPVATTIRRSRKYAQILASIRAIGLVEPLVVAATRETTAATYTLLDGSVRYDILKELGERDALCLIATEQDFFTYNYRINRLSTVREHRMMLRAIEQGVSPDRLAVALNIDIGSIKRKTRLLDKICPEAVGLLEDRHVSGDVFRLMRRMVPERQIEAARLMVAMNKSTVSYARTLLAATTEAQLLPGRRRAKPMGASAEQVALMQRESASFEREFKVVEQSYGADQFDLVLARGYLTRVMSNSRVAQFLERNYSDLYAEFSRITDARADAA